MSLSRRTIDRHLSDDERELVAQTDGSALRAAGHGDLTTLQRHLRERRDRARSAASRQRREMRGKADPKGARAATGNAGTVGKFDLLTGALKRLGKEITRRRKAERGNTQSDYARKALDLKSNAAPSPGGKPEDRTADAGMRNLPNSEQPPSGALDHGGARSALMRSKIAR